MNDMIIDLKDWELNRAQLIQWCLDTKAEVYAYITYGANASSSMYGFKNVEDLTQFKLTFRKKESSSDEAYFYCPYIPDLLK